METDPRGPEFPIACTSHPSPDKLAPNQSCSARNAYDFDEIGSLTVATVHLPWYRSLLRQLHRGVPLPPLEVTSKPVAVKPIWGAYNQQGRGLLCSTALHVAAVVLLFAGLSSPYLERAAMHSIDLYVPVDAAQFLTALRNEIGGKGGGGLNSPLPVSRGKLPRFDVQQLAPAMLEPAVNARLMVEPTLLGPQDIQAATLDLKWFGDPLAEVGPPPVPVADSATKKAPASDRMRAPVTVPTRAEVLVEYSESAVVLARQCCCIAWIPNTRKQRAKREWRAQLCC
jgi:hypothetical protein